MRQKALFLLFLGACNSGDVDGLRLAEVGPTAQVVVMPSSLIFGSPASLESEQKVVMVTNTGNSELSVRNLAIEAGAGDFTVEGAPFRLGPGASRQVTVLFTPSGNPSTIGRLIVSTNDRDVPVDLLGFGASPDLLVYPPFLDFTDQAVPCVQSQPITLENIGSSDLLVSELQYTSGGQLRLEGSAEQEEFTLSPGEQQVVWVSYDSSVSTGEDVGELTIVSNDPAGPSTVVQVGSSYFESMAEDQFLTPSPPVVDVLLLSDQSGSMKSNQEQVMQGIPDLFEELTALSEWQFGLIVDANACMRGPIVTSSSPGTGAYIASQVFEGQDVPGFDPVSTLSEQLLSQAVSALSKTGEGQCNEGLVRQGALLHLILLSDEREQSPSGWQSYVDELIAFKGDPALVKVSVVADLTSESSCGYYSPGDADSGADGYEQSAQYTGGVSLNICDSGWGSELSNLATELLSSSSSYQLLRPAAGFSLEVLVNGQPATYLFSDALNRVTITDPPVAPGDEVTVSYGVLSECF